MRTVSKTVVVVILLLIGWDLFSDDFLLPSFVIYLLMAVNFALMGIADMKERDKKIAYFALFASAVLFTLLVIETVRVF